MSMRVLCSVFLLLGFAYQCFSQPEIFDDPTVAPSTAGTGTSTPALSAVSSDYISALGAMQMVVSRYDPIYGDRKNAGASFAALF
jgi:hypothetical protein